MFRFTCVSICLHTRCNREKEKRDFDFVMLLNEMKKKIEWNFNQVCVILLYYMWSLRLFESLLLLYNIIALYATISFWQVFSHHYHHEYLLFVLVVSYFVVVQIVGWGLRMDSIKNVQCSNYAFLVYEEMWMHSASLKHYYGGICRARLTFMIIMSLWWCITQ